MFSLVFRPNWLNDGDKDVAVATVLDANDGIEDLLSGLIVSIKYRRPNFPMSTTVPVPIAYGLDKQGTGERNVLIFDPGGETCDEGIFGRQDYRWLHLSRWLGLGTVSSSTSFTSSSESSRKTSSRRPVLSVACHPLVGRAKRTRSDRRRNQLANPAEKVLGDSEIDKSAVNTSSSLVIGLYSLYHETRLKLLHQQGPGRRVIEVTHNTLVEISTTVLGKMKQATETYLGEKVTHAF
ncbi:hypothetical protein FRC00_005871, partial [Tulasnella sp. 408]